MRNLTDAKSVNEQVNEICEKSHHMEILRQVPKAQLVRLISVLKDLKNGIPLAKSLEVNDALERISSDEDLNKADDDVIER